MKYGQLIDQKVPVLVMFGAEWHESYTPQKEQVKMVAAELKDDVKVHIIDVDRNQCLADALKVKTLPTIMVYKDGACSFRSSGEISSETLIDKVKN